MPRTSVRGTAVRFGAASRAACCRILLAGIGLLFVGEVPLSFRFRNPAFAGESPGLSKLENSEAAFRKNASLFLNSLSAGRSPGKCRISKTKREGHFSDKKQPYPSQQNSTTREAQLAAPNRTAVLLPEVHGIFRSRTISVLSLKFPCHPLFEILHLSAGVADRIKAENRSPISSTFRGGRGCGDGDSERFVRKT